jgi:hypothetical protein
MPAHIISGVLVDLFAWPVLTLSSEVIGVPTLPAYKLTISAALGWWWLCSVWGLSDVSQPCWWLVCCFCCLQLLGLVEGLTEWCVTTYEKRCCFSSLSLILSTNAWAALLWMKSMVNPTRSQCISCSTAAAYYCRLTIWLDSGFDCA